MKYQRFQAQIGEVLKISDRMSLRFEKIAPDVSPVWYEIPAEDGRWDFKEGTFIEVTDDIWFAYHLGRWRTMTQPEHIEAERQCNLNSH